MANLASADERRKKYQRLVGEIGKKTGPMEGGMYTPKYGNEPGPLTPSQERFLKAKEPAATPAAVGKTGATKPQIPGLMEKSTRTITPVEPISKYRMSNFPGDSAGVSGTGMAAPGESTLRRRIKENITRTQLPAGKGYSSHAWEKTVDVGGGMRQPNVNYDPNAMMPEGFYGPGGTFNYGPRVRPWETGTLINYATGTVKDPKLREIIAQGIAKQAGVLDPETGRIGSELARRGEQKLAGIKGRYAENVARIGAQGEIEKTKMLAETPYYQERGTSPEYKVGRYKETGEGEILDTATGQMAGAELPAHIKRRWSEMREADRKKFYQDHPEYQSAIEQLYR